MRRRRYLANAKRLVVKVGTSNLTDERSRLDPEKIKKLVDETMEIRREGRETIIITSGAIGAGVGRLNLSERPSDMPSLQAAAAIGQGILMHAYREYFEKYDQPVAQILATREDFTDPVRSKNFRNTVNTLLRWNVIPIVNENDTVAVEEIKLGDNDTLAAFVATSLQADLLIMLSDVDGLYTGDPNADEGVELISTVEKITPEIEKLAGKASRGFGGMITKIQAAKIVSEFGIPMVIVNGGEKNVLKRVLAGEEIGTMFVPRGFRG
ncbi:MAG: glutamate 5-kinase [Hadesarchaea archaeon]|nr:glutamate 5-kinase [Hadesarchaea archaeon]